MLGLLTFIGIFGVLVLIHEFGHFYFAKKAGILVREFAIGMGPKIFSHRDKEGTLYTLRILPLGGYVRMAGWGEDKTDIRTGSPASLSLDETGLVRRINLSEKVLDDTALPVRVLSYDLEDHLEIKADLLGEVKIFSVAHDATIIEADGTELRIAPLDVQYQNASVWGRFLTNFAGPLNNFILGLLAFILLVFMQGGVRDYETNRFQVSEQGALAQSGLSGQIEVLTINGQEVTDWDSLSLALNQATKNWDKADQLKLLLKVDGQEKKLELLPQERDGRYLIGVEPVLKTGLWDKLKGGVVLAGDSALAVVTALRQLLVRPDVSQLGGPIAIYQMSSSAAKEGLAPVLHLMAMLSINIGIFNLLPIPALDGGKIVLNLLEAIRKKPLRQEIEGYITLAGVVIMLFLMIAVTWNDIIRTFF